MTSITIVPNPTTPTTPNPLMCDTDDHVINLHSLATLPAPLFLLLSEQMVESKVITSFNTDTQEWLVSKNALSSALHASAQLVLDTLLMFMANEAQEAETGKSKIVLLGGQHD